MSTAAPARPTPAATQRQTAAPETFNQIQSLTRRVQAMLSTGQAHGAVVGVTSCSRREGVSVVAGNLAICAAELYGGKVLLVDANPKNASAASRFGLKQAPGLADCLAGELAFQECVARAARSDLYVLPAGKRAIPPARCCDERASTMFNNLRHEYQLIVVDLPPTNEMDEAILASKLADGFLLVVEAERVRQQVAQRVVRQLEQLDARLLGVVLNKRKNHVPEWLYRRL